MTNQERLPSYSTNGIQTHKGTYYDGLIMALDDCVQFTPKRQFSRRSFSNDNKTGENNDCPRSGYLNIHFTKRSTNFTGIQVSIASNQYLRFKILGELTNSPQRDWLLYYVALCLFEAPPYSTNRNEESPRKGTVLLLTPCDWISTGTVRHATQRYWSLLYSNTVFETPPWRHTGL